MADKWQPIETAPENEDILVASPRGRMVAQRSGPEWFVSGHPPPDVAESGEDRLAGDWFVGEEKFQIHFEVSPLHGSVRGDAHEDDLAGLMWRGLSIPSLGLEWTPVILTTE